MKKIILFFVVGCMLSAVFYSCKPSKERIYNEDGQLIEEIITINDSVKKHIYYGLDDQNIVSHEAHIKNDTTRDGPCIIYYPDGKILWSGNFDNGELIDDCYLRWNECDSIFLGVEIEGGYDWFERGKKYNFRVLLPNVYPCLYRVVDVNYKSLARDSCYNHYSYRYSIETPPNGECYFRIVFADENGFFIVA